MKNKKISKIEKTSLIYKDTDFNVCKIDDILHMFGEDDFSTNDIIEMVRLGIQNDVDEEFWNISVNDNDRNNAKPVNLMYWLSGGDAVWKKFNIWKYEWNNISSIFLEHFNAAITQMIHKTKTLGDIKDNINIFQMEDFYELGLKLDLVNHEDIL